MVKYKLNIASQKAENMPAKNLSLQHFSPAELELTEVLVSADKIIIKLKSHTHSCKCPTCGTVSTKYHETYICQVQDLPILVKNPELKNHAYEYRCENPECPVSTLAETFDGFLNFYSRMTEGRDLSVLLCSVWIYQM